MKSRKNIRIATAIIGTLGLIIAAFISNRNNDKKAAPIITNAPVINTTLEVRDTNETPKTTEQPKTPSAKTVAPETKEVSGPNVKITTVKGTVNIAEKQEIGDQTVNN